MNTLVLKELGPVPVEQSVNEIQSTLNLTTTPFIALTDQDGEPVLFQKSEIVAVVTGTEASRAT